MDSITIAGLLAAIAFMTILLIMYWPRHNNYVTWTTSHRNGHQRHFGDD
jgi:hypothetical protein